MWNPFEHFGELPFTNVFAGRMFGLEWQPTVTLPTGQVVPSAIEGRPETVQGYLKFGDLYEPITEDQLFVQQLWLRAKYGGWAPRPDSDVAMYVQLGLADEYSITLEAMREAVLSLPHVMETITANGYSEADVWAYAQAEAPWAIELVGIA